MSKFKKGDRVRFNAEAIAHRLRSEITHASRGVILQRHRTDEPHQVRVLWDDQAASGSKKGTVYGDGWLEPDSSGERPIIVHENHDTGDESSTGRGCQHLTCGKCGAALLLQPGGES